MSKSKNPLVTVITATYNDEKYIEASIQSVLSQNFTDFEYIIINDGSSDNTRAIIESLQKQDPRIRLVNQTNQGVVAARNNALRLAKGQYIAVIDGDDQWLPGKLKAQISLMQTDQSLVLVGGGLESINEESVPLGFAFYPTRDVDIRYSLCISNQFNHSSVLYKLSIAKEIGLYPDTCPVEDMDFLSRFMEYGKIANIPYPIFRYRSNPAGISQNSNDTQSSMEKDISLRNWNHVQPKPLSRQDIMTGARFYLDNPVSQTFGVTIKHGYIYYMTRIGYRMISKRQLVDGLRQLIHIASTGRTGLRMVFHCGADIVKAKLRGDQSASS